MHTNTHTRHFEVHIIVSSEEADVAAQGGLPMVPYDTIPCANCGTGIGRSASATNRFIPMALVLGDVEEFHHLCLSCTAPVLNPKA